MANEKGASSAQPLFYRETVALSRARHGNLRFRGLTDFSFARTANAVPIHIGEFALAVKHYPIVFSEAPHVPLAVLGLAKNENLFVNDKGQWAEDTYIPAYVRRYPFILGHTAKAGQFNLAIDEASGALSEGPEGEPLFNGNAPSKLAKKAVDFCDEFRRRMELTEKFCAAIAEDELLEKKEAGISLPKNQKRRVLNFNMISEPRLDALPDKRILFYRRSKFLHPIYLHMVSAVNWRSLAHMAAKSI